MTEAPLAIQIVRVEHESGMWAEINAARSRAVGQALARNTYFRDLLPIMAPLVRAWGRGDGPLIVDVLVSEEAPAVLGEDGETELIPARTVWDAVTRELPPPCEDPQSILALSDAEPDLARWLHLQTILAPKTWDDTQGKASGLPSGDTPDGMPAEATPAITTMPSSRVRASSSRPAASISA